MATKVVCDRCGKDIVSGCNGLIWFNRDQVSPEGSFSTGAGMDLCQRCADQLGEFMANKPRKVQRWETFPHGALDDIEVRMTKCVDCRTCPLEAKPETDSCCSSHDTWVWLHEEVEVEA